MTPVSTQPTRTSSTPRAAPPHRDAPPEDAKAMRAALAKAGEQQRQPAMPLTARGKQQAKGGGQQLAQQAEASPATVRAMTLGDRKGPVGEREQGEGRQEGQGFGAPASTVPPIPMQAVAVPPPTVDPSAFAQLMTQLWSREHGKGAKEVRVQLGVSAWPATGARLVRNAAGTLDIAVEFGAPASNDERALAALRDRFEDQGVEVGALAFEDA